MFVDIKTDVELADVAKLFYGDIMPNISLARNGRNFAVDIDGKRYDVSLVDSIYDIIPEAHMSGRLSKIALYDALNSHTGQEMPWGALTGVRPTKLFYEAMRAGKTEEQATEIMQRVYRVGSSRATILKRIVGEQKGKVEFPTEYVNMYVHIPYCTTRCSYCSFVSAPIDKNRAQSKEYVSLLCDEITRSKELLWSSGKKILSVYIGGGTPTALDARELDALLSAIGKFDCEYTCEAGRPDTVSEEKLEVLKAHGVTRVCVNPQTLNQKTLDAIGRKHTVKQFFDVYDMVKARGFDINCDLIAGLEGETLSDFIFSFDGVRALKPHNITVHSLSRKNGSAIRYNEIENIETSKMTDYALANLDKYNPYYLYRQKRQACNLENVGFSLPNKQCINNITTMEETVGVMACGAGAISKFVHNGNISRFANMRDVPLYISRYEEKLQAKLDYWSAALQSENNCL